GFGVRAAPPGRREPKATASYYLQFWLGGRHEHGGHAERVKIGRHGDKAINRETGQPFTWTADSARKEAERIRGLFFDGENPAEEKRAERKAAADKHHVKRHGETFKAAWEAYSKAVLRAEADPKRTADEQDRLIETGVFPELGGTAFALVTNA